jgi:hypothetical protein
MTYNVQKCRVGSIHKVWNLFGNYHLSLAEQKLWIGLMNFDILGEIADIETITKGSGIRDLHRLRKTYGAGDWRKMKGIARIRLSTGRVRLAELHWYEAHGIGKKEIKRKRYLE